MSVEVIARTPMPMCGAQSCRGVADRGGLCVLHRRAFQLTTKVQDALLEFVNGIRPLSANDKDIVSAGDYLADGLSLLVGVVFDEVIEFDKPLLVVDYGEEGQRRPRWRVDLKWQIADEGYDDE
ncbi:hypothetical protein [Mycobacterium sp. 1165196.3]|uniref:hypothetical protein n=1 Tax=Mycobacterium sp. 1165196.3 TaxID=1834071 RepID=UPI0012E9C0AB|nr:hypothetical protein [Mycobacterium sp. 1165196.3]